MGRSSPFTPWRLLPSAQRAPPTRPGEGAQCQRLEVAGRRLRGSALVAQNEAMGEGTLGLMRALCRRDLSQGGVKGEEQQRGGLVWGSVVVHRSTSTKEGARGVIVWF